jgi:excisionase family DNA binding protein
MGTMLKVRQVALRLGISESLVYKKIEEGELKASRFGKEGCRGTIRVSEEDLLAYLDACRASPNGDDGDPEGHID